MSHELTIFAYYTTPNWSLASFSWCATSSEFESVSFMGVSNSGVFLTEKDLTSIGFNFLAKPTLEFQDDDHECGNCETARSGEGKFDKKQEEKEREEQEEEKCKVKVTPMDLKMSSLAEFKVEEDDDNDGFKTPTSVDHKIPLILPCPPAPKKPKSLPSTKRRAAGPNRRVLLDLSNEIQSLFPPDFGGKSKRLRQGGKWCCSTSFSCQESKIMLLISIYENFVFVHLHFHSQFYPISCLSG